MSWQEFSKTNYKTCKSDLMKSSGKVPTKGEVYKELKRKFKGASSNHSSKSTPAIRETPHEFLDLTSRRGGPVTQMRKKITKENIKYLGNMYKLMSQGRIQ